DSTMYTTSGMLRTMELILGLPPMSQYDAAAMPMYNSFTSIAKGADLSPFKHLEARIDLAERNPENAPGSQRSGQLDFSKEDAAPDVEFNEIIWKSVRGADSRMPAPVRSGFVRAIEEDYDDKGDKGCDRKERNERRGTGRHR